jgi:type III secretion protein J
MNLMSFKRALLIGLIGTLVGCSRTVATDVSERDSTEIVVALRSQGIAATRGLTDSKKWAVSVDSSDWADANSVLLSSGLPKVEPQGYSELLKKDSMITSPSTEKAKLLWAASNELSRSLQEIDGVVSARVHLVIPDKDPFREKQRLSSASVLIKHSAEIKATDLEPAIRSFVSKSAEGLGPEAVSITFVAARPLQLVRDSATATNSIKKFATTAALIGGGALVLLLGWFLVAERKSKQLAASSKISKSAKVGRGPQ